MPLYDYECRSCGKVTEVRHGFKESHTDACPSCGGELARRFSAAAIVFKGSGFYVTDSRKSSGGSDASKSDTAKSEPAKTEPSKTEPVKTESASSATTTTGSGPSKTEAAA